MTYEGTFIELTPLVQPTTWLTLSNVFPEIPNAVLIHNTVQCLSRTTKCSIDSQSFFILQGGVSGKIYSPGI